VKSQRLFIKPSLREA